MRRRHQPLHRDGVEPALADEIAYHIELETRRQVDLGHDPATARARALDRFGDPAAIAAAIHREQRPRFPERMMHELTSAVKSLLKHRGYALVAALTLALGIGATTAAFAVLDSVLLRPLPYRDSERVVLLQDQSRTGTAESSSFPNFIDWRDRARSMSGVASEMYPIAQTVTTGGDPFRAAVMGVSRNFFSVLGATPLVGREFTADENRAGATFSVIASWDFWQTHLGGRRELGTIQVGGTAIPVVGVMPRGFRFVDDADLWFPHEQWPGTCRTCRNYRVIGRLAPGASVARAQAEMTTISHDLVATYGVDEATADVRVIPLREALVGGYNAMLLAVLAAAGLVLLVACTNLVTMQLARGTARGQEMAVRAALGASRPRLVGQLLLESASLAAVGTALGWFLAIAMIRIVRVVGAGLVPRLDELAVDARVLAFAAAVGAGTVMLIGLYPAMRLAFADPSRFLAGARGSSATVRSALWRVLVAFEVAIAVVLLVGSLLLIRTLRNILTADTGINSHGVVTASLVVGDTVDLARLDRVGAGLGALPGVGGVAFTNRMPLGWGSTAGPVRRPTDPVDHDFPAMAGFRLVSANYFDVLGQRVLQGRGFTSADRAGNPGVAVVTPGIAAKLWPGENPVGKEVITNYLSGERLTVVGVVSEASSWTMPRGQQNEIYTPLSQHPARAEGQLVAMVRSKGDAAAAIPMVRRALHDLAPDLPARLGILEERISKSAADRRFAMIALSLFAGIALLLAAIGVYGTMAYIVAARTHEVGVRMALGATPGRVRRHVLAESLVVALAGIAAGAGGCIFAARLLRSMLYGVGHLDPVSYIGAALVLIVAVLLGAFVPALRSSRVDPLVAMRAAA